MGVARSREPGSNADTASECAIHVLRSWKCTCPNTTGTIQSYRRPAWKTADAWLSDPSTATAGFNTPSFDQKNSLQGQKASHPSQPR